MWHCILYRYSAILMCCSKISHLQPQHSPRHSWVVVHFWGRRAIFPLKAEVSKQVFHGWMPFLIRLSPQEASSLLTVFLFLSHTRSHSLLSELVRREQNGRVQPSSLKASSIYLFLLSLHNYDALCVVVRRVFHGDCLSVSMCSCVLEYMRYMYLISATFLLVISWLAGRH